MQNSSDPDGVLGGGCSFSQLLVGNEGDRWRVVVAAVVAAIAATWSVEALKLLQ